jgi:hypothetical protein
MRVFRSRGPLLSAAFADTVQWLQSLGWQETQEGQCDFDARRPGRP